MRKKLGKSDEAWKYVTKLEPHSYARHASPLPHMGKASSNPTEPAMGKVSSNPTAQANPSLLENQEFALYLLLMEM